MRILMLHNYYQQRGGEDESTEQELTLLKQQGHKVYFYNRHNDEIKTYHWLQKGPLFFKPTWATDSYTQIRNIIQTFQPDIAHFQNFFPLISPSAYYACHEEGVPIIQMLRNYRLLCANSYFFRDGQVCEDCLNHSLWHAIRHKCYRDSRIQTLSLVFMLTTHRLLKTWTDKINAFITLTQFSRHKFIEGGLPAAKIFVRPNFLATDPGSSDEAGQYALFVGRLEEPKGIPFLLNAWRNLPAIPLKIVGDGPLFHWAKDYIAEHHLTHIEMVGKIPLSDVLTYMQKARFLVMPSRWYETFGRTIIEAYATGTPVLVSRLGAMTELVKEEQTGFTFALDDVEDLTKKANWLWLHPEKSQEMGKLARQEFENNYTAAKNYENLMQIYHQVIT